jgi:prepilin peptidase CpaA
MFMELPSGPIWGALFTALLIAGCVTDLRSRRVPNVLVLIIIAGGLVYSVATHPLIAALRSSAAGLLLGFAIWIVFYVAGVIGAGDVKFFSAAGTWLGPSATWRAALVAALAGGVLAVIFLLREKRFGVTLKRMMLAASSRSTTLLLHTPESAGPNHARLPYGVALAAGALVAGWWPRLVR